MMRENQTLLRTKPASVKHLYESYGAMLLGYIFAIVKDREVAESYLVKIFGDISKRFHEIKWGEASEWQLLRRFAKQELIVFTNTVKACEYDSGPAPVFNTSTNKYLNSMTNEQKHIFCSVYYHRYTTAQLAQELNKPEALIQKALKEAFAIIKQSHEN